MSSSMLKNMGACAYKDDFNRELNGLWCNCADNEVYAVILLMAYFQIGVIYVHT